MKNFEIFQKERKKKVSKLIELQMETFEETQNQLLFMRRNVDEILEKLKIEKELAKSSLENKMEFIDEMENNLLKKSLETQSFNNFEIQKNFEKLNSGLEEFVEFNSTFDVSFESNMESIQSNLDVSMIKLNIQQKNKPKKIIETKLLKSLDNMRIKNSFGYFNDEMNTSMSISSFFELIFDFIPQGYKNFLKLKNTSKEIRQITEKKWKNSSSKIELRNYFLCENVDSLIISNVKEKELKMFLSLHSIKKFYVNFQHECVDLEWSNLIPFMSNSTFKGSIDTIYLIDGHLDSTNFEIFHSGIRHIVLFNVGISFFLEYQPEEMYNNLESISIIFGDLLPSEFISKCGKLKKYFTSLDDWGEQDYSKNMDRVVSTHSNKKENLLNFSNIIQDLIFQLKENTIYPREKIEELEDYNRELLKEYQVGK
jgi:hypothetical protein